MINATPGSGPAASVETNEGTTQQNGDSGSKDAAGGGMRGGYVGLMNCVFAAQKAVGDDLTQT